MGDDIIPATPLEYWSSVEILRQQGAVQSKFAPPSDLSGPG
jgi:hypothetical protein